MPAELITLLVIAFVMASAILPRLSIDGAAVISLAVLVVTGLLTVEEAARGFGNPVILTIGGMFVLAEALQRTGAAAAVRDLVKRAGQRGLRFLLLLLLPGVMVLSGVMNNTGVVVLLLPALLAAGQAMGISPSRLLLPMSYASITGGTLTLVGTTTTLLVDALVREQGMPGLGLLEILPMGAVFCIIALTYLVLAGPLLLPDRAGLATPITPAATRQYLTEMRLHRNSRLLGRTVEDLRKVWPDLRVLQVIRDEETFWPPFTDLTLAPEDVLLVKAPPELLLDTLARTDVSKPGAETAPEVDVAQVDVALGEVMIAPGSRLVGSTIRSARMRESYGVTALAILRRGAHLRKQIGDVDLGAGDVLLVEGSPEAIERFSRRDRDLILLGTELPEPPERRKAPIAITISVAALAGAALGLVPLSISVLVASVLLVITGCVTSSRAYRSINLRILIVIGAMLGLGRAVESTGLAQDVAGHLVGIGGAWGATGVLAMIYLATLILTELVTNAATASVMIPIALRVADTLQVSPRPFIFAIALAASCSFLTPVGYQTNLLVYGPGGYRLQDYLKLGAPLSVLLWIAAVLLLPIVFPF